MSAVITISQLLYGLICMIGVLGNLLVLYVIYNVLFHRQKMSVTIRCISHLAIADLITALGIPFLIARLANNYWPFGEYTCKFYQSSIALPEFAKAFLLTLLGMFCYAMHRGTIYELDNTKVSILLASCWFIALLIAIPVYLYSSAHNSDECNVFWPENVYASDAYVLIFAICVFITPLLIGLLLHKKRNKSPFPGEDISLVNKTMNLVFVLVGAHVVLLFPYLMGQLITNFHKHTPGIGIPEWKINLALVSGWIWSSSCAMFPVLYNYASDDFKEGLHILLEDLVNLNIPKQRMPF